MTIDDEVSYYVENSIQEIGSATVLLSHCRISEEDKKIAGEYLDKALSLLCVASNILYDED